MKSATVPSFWKAYGQLDKVTKERAERHSYCGQKIRFIRQYGLSALIRRKIYGPLELQEVFVQLES